MLGYPQNQERSPLDPVVDGLAADRCSAAAQDDPHLLGGPHRAGDLRCPAWKARHLLLHRRHRRLLTSFRLVNNVHARAERIAETAAGLGDFNWE